MTTVVIGWMRSRSRTIDGDGRVGGVVIGRQEIDMIQEPYILITADTHAGGSHAQYREYLDPAVARGI